MAADTFLAFCLKRLWFPCKFFALDAASLTVLAVTMKLPVGISELMPGHTDQLFKLASTAFMCVVIGNFMPSIKTMSDKEILSNVVALDILVITIIVNLCIEMYTGLIFNLKYEFIATIFLMFLLILVLSFSSLTLATSKRILELYYKEAYQTTLRDDAVAFGKLSINRLRETVEKCWMMVETSNPQFVMARSINFSTSGAICVLAFLILLEALFRIYHSPPYFPNSSTYKWTTTLVLIVQSIGVVVGTIGKAILLNTEGHSDLVGEKLFERLSITIADILSACFTNLPRAITMACNAGAIEEREKSVHRSALLVGKTEEILKIIQHRELPNIIADQSAYIDHWKLTLQPTNLVPVIPSILQYCSDLSHLIKSQIFR